MLRQKSLKLNAAINFVDVRRAKLSTRMCGRKPHEDDKEETARQRLAEYHKNTDALIDYYRRQGVLKDIPATGTPPEVYTRVIMALGC